jgi:hypothetical protein
MRYPRAVLPYGKPGYIRTMRPSGSRYLAVLRRRPWVAALLTAVPVAGAAAVVLTAVLSRPGPAPVPVRVRSWRADIAYLARELPHKHIDGLTGASRATWDATAAHLEAEVPQLTDGQVIAGMLRLIALLRDDETFLQLSWRRIYPFHAVWLGRGLYLTAVPAARHDLLGARLEAIDGHPLSAVIARLQPEIDYLPQDTGVARDSEASYVSLPEILNWTGLARSQDSATFTVRTVSGQRENVTLAAVFDQATLSALRFARVPRTLAQRNDTSPYWMRVFPGRRAVYLKYNQCLDSNGFQRLALKAVAILRHRPTYRLIVDLRGNGGGSDAPFQTLINGIRADPAINRPGRLFGLIDGETDSSAARDASSLGRLTNALLLGQEVEDPVDEFGNDDGLLTLPHSHLAVTYTTKVLNAATARLAPPDIVITPTISQVLAGTDPVLDRALSYPLPSRAGR